MPPGRRRAWVTEAHLCSRQPLPARGRGQRPALRSPSLPGTRVLQAYARSAEEVRQLLGDRGGRRAGGGVRREERGEGRGARGGWPWVREDPFTAEQTRWPLGSCRLPRQATGLQRVGQAAPAHGKNTERRLTAPHVLTAERHSQDASCEEQQETTKRAFPKMSQGPSQLDSKQSAEVGGWGCGPSGPAGRPGPGPVARPELLPQFLKLALPRVVSPACPLHVPRANERALRGCPKACGPLQGQCGGCPRRHTLELDPAMSREKELEGGGERSRGAIVTACNGRRRGWPGTQLEWPAVTSGTTHTPQNARRGGATICPAGDPP